MASTDAAFAGSIPAIYDRFLTPLLFAPYAEEVASRIAAVAPGRILETAAGTGALTAELRRRLPDAEIVATDLNQAMIDVARERIGDDHVSYQAVDAQSLPFRDGRFDALACQFGVMFYPDRGKAYREARRVLAPGAPFLFATWDRLEANPVSQVVAGAVAELFPDDPPSFLARVPFGYHDPTRIVADLEEAGFAEVKIETVARRSRADSARDVATGLVQGSPLRAEIEARDPARLDEATAAAERGLTSVCDGDGRVDAPMSALIVAAR